MRRYWLKNWIARRQTFGDYHNVMRELEAENPESMFRELLHRIEPRITKQTINMRIPLEPGVKLAITLRYLATGSSYKTQILFIPKVAGAIVAARVWGPDCHA